jgi:uncharacterized protein
MPQTLFLNVTLATASVLGLIYIVLMLRIVRMRFQNRISLGDGGNAEILKRIRAHGNFAEYVPLLLILMGLLELAGTNKTWLAMAGAVLVVCRICHVIGIHRQAPNLFRVVGTVGTATLIIAFCVYGLILTFSA